jgi:hypothetical protein
MPGDDKSSSDRAALQNTGTARFTSGIPWTPKNLQFNPASSRLIWNYCAQYYYTLLSVEELKCLSEICPAERSPGRALYRLTK